MRLLDWKISYYEDPENPPELYLQQPHIVAEAQRDEQIYRLSVSVMSDVRYKSQLACWPIYATEYNILYRTNGELPSDWKVHQLMDALIDQAEEKIFSPMEMLAAGLQ